MKYFFFGLFAALISTWVYLSFAKTPPPPSGDYKIPLNWQTSAEEITRRCENEGVKLIAIIESIEAANPSDISFTNSVRFLNQAFGDFSFVMDPLSFYKYTSTDKSLRDAADACEKKAGKLFIDIFTRKKLFEIVKAAKEKNERLSAIDQKLLDQLYNDFKRNGLELDDKKLAVFIAKKKAIVDLQAEFSTTLNDWNETIEVKPEELEGLPNDYIQGLKKTANGASYIVTLKYPDYFPFMEDGKNAEARKRLFLKFQSRGGEKNRERLKKTLMLREELAKMLGYKNHAEFVLAERMAKNPEAVRSFLDALIPKLKPLGAKEIEELTELKRKELKDPNIKTIEEWDRLYYANQLKKQKYEVDQQKVKEYFPLNKVVAGMFEVYQTLLGVEYVQIANPKAWDESVQGYAVLDAKTKAVISYFYTDLFPREGKYGHAAAFTLIKGRQNEDGSYEKPVSSIVANFNKPLGNNPSLLTHDQVETFFHEFGHIMHQVLTKAKYDYFSGTSVKNDFVEAPSQMLENWVWKKSSLEKLSSHYKTGKPLPEELLKKLLAAKNSDLGLRYLRQAFFASVDINLHTTDAMNIDTTKIWGETQNEVMGIPLTPKIYPEASFGHIMGGYDSGYYGYLWSEVYAQDMFSRFEKEGLLNAMTGADYRKFILEPGGELEPDVLLKKFLGRDPNQKAFLKELGLK